jgi:hypothetical protein
MVKNLNVSESSVSVNDLELSATIPIDHSYTGIYRDGMTAGESLSLFDVAYLKSDGKWWKADAASVSTSRGMLALALEPIDAEATGKFLLEGYVRDDSWNCPTGSVLYLSDTVPGGVDAVIPSGVGDVVRIAGYAVSPDIFYFKPSSTYIEVSSKNVNGVDLGTTVVEDYIVGIAWDSSDSSPTTSLSYVDKNGDALAAVPFDFNDHPVWGNIRRCTLSAAGAVTYGPNARGDGLTLDTDAARVMVEIPKFYVRAQDSGTVRTLWISPYAETGFELHPAFRQRGGTARNHIYVSAYQTTAYDDGGTAKLASKTGQTPDSGQVIGWFRTRAQNIGSGWGIMNAHTWSAIQMLWLIEYGNLNSQGTIGPGITDNAVAMNTGVYSMDTQMSVYGTGVGTNTVTPTKNPIAWRGIENLWGNLFSWIDGIEVYDAAIRIIKEDGTGTFGDTMGAGSYQTATITPLTSAASGGCITDIGWDPTYCKYMFIPISGTGADICGTYFCSNCFGHNVGEADIVMVGSSKASGGCGGIFRWDMDQTITDAYPNANARIEYIGPVTGA